MDFLFCYNLPMEFIHSEDGKDGAIAMGDELAEALKKGSVTWLVCGGSSIALAVIAMRHLREKTSEEDLARLTVGLTDERYGDVGHKDSNWQQLLDAGFDTAGVDVIPTLIGAPLAETVTAYAEKLDRALDADTVIVQFGIGADGHIAGILPGSSAVTAAELVAGYEAGPYTRITMTPPAFDRVDIAYAFVFGESKREAVEKLRTQDLSISDMPSQLLKQIPAKSIHTDVYCR